MIRAVIEESGVVLSHKAIAGANWLLTDECNSDRIEQMESRGIPLSQYIKGKIYRGVVTGFNQAFVIDCETRNKLIFEYPASEEIIEPLVIGDDVRKWHLKDKERYLIFTRRGIEIDRYPAIKKHLQQWQSRLEPKLRNWDTSEKWMGRKSGAYKWYEIQDEVAYSSAFDRPKIIYPVMAQSNRFTLDKSGVFINDKAFIIPTDDLYLLGLLKASTDS